jgi:hypothetical protein
MKALVVFILIGLAFLFVLKEFNQQEQGRREKCDSAGGAWIVNKGAAAGYCFFNK